MASASNTPGTSLTDPADGGRASPGDSDPLQRTQPILNVIDRYAPALGSARAGALPFAGCEGPLLETVTPQRIGAKASDQRTHELDFNCSDSVKFWQQ